MCLNSVAKDSLFSQKKTLNIQGTLVSLETPRVMGILNVTPDSFYSGSRVATEEAVLRQAEKFVQEGAFFLDIGGYSSRPGADDVPLEEELVRTIPAIEAVVREFPEVYVSVDTFRAPVARAAVEAGAHLINDISGGQLDPEMFTTVALLGVPYILMHMRGTPQTMKSLTKYDNLLTEMGVYFSERVQQLQALGVRDIVLDPGFGFAKTVEQNFKLLRNFDYFLSIGHPVLAGVSRKSMIWRTLDITAAEALNGTTVLNTIALTQGASILRVHDVREAMETVTLVNKL
ncbi:MAG TPA: dihydropteroate synthase [Cytophagales bacterium]|nr:dihydropteroate synthase [Cytophagales bacterium]HAP63184.1 dihydropteroate synthase [Cytophagales bacterium]